MRFVAAALLAAALAWTNDGLAQPRAAIPPADDMEAAKAHFAAGSAYYDQANYADAVKEFNEAFRLSKRSDLLYNIAVCYERLNDLDNAIGALRRYLAERPDATDRVTIQSRIANLEKRRAQQPPPVVAAPPPELAAPPVVAPPPPLSTSVERRGGPKWYVPGVALLATGAGLGLVGLGTGLATHAVYSDLNTKCPNLTCDESMRGTVNGGRALGIGTDVILGVGLAVGVSGAIVMIVQSRPVRK
jgi:tetratricopeptide (TPR) repeat protein